MGNTLQANEKDVTHERNHVWFGGDERIRTAGAAFAEPCLTTWRRRRVRTQAYERRGWSGRRGSNPRLSPWQGDALPLSHSRVITAHRVQYPHVTQWAVRDSNSHGLRQRILSPPCLPISATARNALWE